MVWNFIGIIFATYSVNVINFEQPDLAFTYVVVLSSRIPKIPVSIFSDLLLIFFCPYENEPVNAYAHFLKGKKI